MKEGTLQDTEWWAVFPLGNFAFRFGPYTGKEMAEVMQEAIKRQVPLHIVGNCGKDIDWTIAEDLAKGGAGSAAAKGMLDYFTRRHYRTETGE